MNEKEEKITEDVIEKVSEEENSEENLGEFDDNTDTSEVKEENEPKQEEKLYTKEELEAEVERVASSREKRAYTKSERKSESKLKEYSDIVDTLMVGMKKNSIEELKGSLNDFYSEQGIEMPRTSKLSEREEKILAKADAEEIIELGEDEVNRVANDIYSKPEEKRTLREKIIFDTLGKHAMQAKAKKSLEEHGIDTNILEDKSFKEFASKFSAMTPLSDVYDVYSKIHSKESIKEETKVERPKSTGSIKTVPNTNEIKSFYTKEEVSKFTMKDLDNPKLMKAVEDSMSQW